MKCGQLKTRIMKNIFTPKYDKPDHMDGPYGRGMPFCVVRKERLTTKGHEGISVALCGYSVHSVVKNNSVVKKERLTTKDHEGGTKGHKGTYTQGSSWAEKSVKLLPKRTLAILKVPNICLVPVKYLAHNGIGHDRLDDAQDTLQDTAQVRELIINIEGKMTREEIQKKLNLTHWDVPGLTCGLAPEERNICRTEFPPKPATLISGRTKKVEEGERRINIQ